jgi:hypothetical protein
MFKFTSKLYSLTRFSFILLLLHSIIIPQVFAQSGCPLNIDFETGTFQNWQCYKGNVAAVNSTNVITVNASVATPGIHTLIPKGTALDPWGKFPTSAPDGSNYSVRLGNDGTNSQTERISYTFTVPTNQTNFVLTYQYAVVLQDGGHNPWQQPRFTAKVFDISSNSYISCSSFDYVATAQLPGFKKSTLSSIVSYKEWTPVSINLSGYQGKQIRLEFTTADCTESGHFGYAYIDINKSCTTLITGADYCSTDATVALTGPSGFDKYNWYNSDKTKLLGTTNPLILTTQPADGSNIVLDVIPFAGFGCPNTISTVVHKHSIGLAVTDPAPVCFPGTIDITQPQLLSLTDNTAIITYWKNIAATIPIADPQHITTSGTYYIRAMNAMGCTEIQPVNVITNLLPNIKITDPPTVCDLSVIDITSPAILAGSSAGLTYTYWEDAAATVPLINAKAIKNAGTYYVKGASIMGCTDVKPIKVTFFALPVLNINPPAAVCFPSVINLTQSTITTGSDANLTLSYWQDLNASVPVTDPSKIAVSGTYYVKANNLNGCQVIKPVNVIVNPLPKLVINDPSDVCFPDKVDLTAAAVTEGSADINKLTYWQDANATIPLTNYTAVADSGRYYIKATNILGCDIINTVLVTIHRLPVLKISPPAKIYQPGKINLTAADIVKGSSPNLKFSYYSDAALTSLIDRPSAIGTTGIYYIKGENTFGCYTALPVEITVALKPDIVVPKAFTPTQATNNKLYPFPVGIKTFKLFIVYNRWGNIVYQTTDPDPDKGWDGRYKGNVLFLDTYTWVAEGFDFVGNLVHRTGNTVLLK